MVSAVLSVPTGYVSSTGPANVTAGVAMSMTAPPGAADAAVSPPIDLAIVLPTARSGRRHDRRGDAADLADRRPPSATAMTAPI
ncbi:MAG: hypothetical protein R2710_11015 [Acidimicrobiales bacterium]